MKSVARSTPSFLAADATPSQILQALMENMQEYILRNVAADGGTIEHVADLKLPDLSPSDREAHLFPQLIEGRIDEQLDALLEFYRSQRPLRQVIYWSLDPTDPPDLAARLLARGFSGNWRPHWMWLDFRSMQAPGSLPPTLRIERFDALPVWDINTLPYYERQNALHRWSRGHGRVPFLWHFGAWLGDRLVGHSALSLTTGERGVAGIFDVGVVPKARRQGIGAAITLAACRFAQELGCHHAVLNATEQGEPMYRRLGFTSLGYGWTWLLTTQALSSPPPAPLHVALAEAVGRGDVVALERLSTHFSPASLQTFSTGEYTLLQLAARLQQNAAAEWLFAHGATLDILSAWDLGWHARVQQLLAATPELANVRIGKLQLTPLHIAVERGDYEFARVLLAAHPDLTLTDSQFHSTALGWAQHLQQTELIHLIEQYQET